MNRTDVLPDGVKLENCSKMYKGYSDGYTLCETGNSTVATVSVLFIRREAFDKRKGREEDN